MHAMHSLTCIVWFIIELRQKISDNYIIESAIFKFDSAAKDPFQRDSKNMNAIKSFNEENVCQRKFAKQSVTQFSGC